MNQDRKNAYYEYREQKYESINTSTCIRRAAEYEERLGKDLCDWNSSEIIDFYKSVCTHSMNFLLNMNSVYKMYTVWCLKEGYVQDGINHYEEITQNVLNQCVNKAITNERIISRERLLSFISLLNNPRDKFICLACFEGITGKEMEELINLDISDFDTKSKTITIMKDGKVKKVIHYSDELYSYAQEANDTYEYIFDSVDRPNGVHIDGFSKPLVGKHIIKRIAQNNYDINEPITVLSLYRCIDKLQAELGVSAITSKALKESGRIHMIRETMRKNNCTAIEAIKSNPDIEKIYGNIISKPAFLEKYNDFLK